MKKDKTYWTFAELVERCQGKTDAEVALLQERYNQMHGIDSDDLYPPEEAERRFTTVVRAALRVPPADEEEAELRRQISKEWKKK